MEKTYALAGFSKMGQEDFGGIGVFSCDPESGELTFMHTDFREINVGYQTYDEQSKLLYVTDERWDQYGCTGGGGNVAAFSIDSETGHLEKQSMQRTFSDNPTWLVLDREKSHMLVTHHTLPKYVTQYVAPEDGGPGAVTTYEDCMLDVFRIGPDGTIGQLQDAVKIEGFDIDGKHCFPHLHCVTSDPSGEFYLVTDKGLDRIYSFRIEEKTGRLMKASEISFAKGEEPRYGVWHPYLPIYYGNFEGTTDIVSCTVAKDGKLTETGRCSCTRNRISPDNGQDGSMPSDIVVSPDGRFLFVSIRTNESIAVIGLAPDGSMELLKETSCGGRNPRGLFVSSDGRHLYVCHYMSREISLWDIGADGTLTEKKRYVTERQVGNMEIITTESEF